MKVYFSKYRDHWISPYTVLERVLWWRDWKNQDYDAVWVKRWTDRLAPVSQAIQRVLDWAHPQIRWVKIDRYDTWNMDGTLSLIVLPMLKQLQASKHGSPFVDDEDVPEHFMLRSYQAPPKTDEWHVDANHHDRWTWVLGELIWTFEQLQPDCDWESLYSSGTADFKFVKTDGDMYEMIRGPRDNYHLDRLGMDLHQQRIDRGLQLFGKYYQALWD
jgi:hypothetical protein